MTPARGVVTVLVIGLTLAIGIIVGVLLQQYVHFDTVRQMLETQRRAAAYSARRHDPKQWALDSAGWADTERRVRANWAPREIARRQAMQTCAVSFEIRDTTLRHMQLLKVDAWDRDHPQHVIAEGWTFAPSGFGQRDTATVVFPNVWCGDIVIGGLSYSLIPGDSLGLSIRK